VLAIIPILSKGSSDDLFILLDLKIIAIAVFLYNKCNWVAFIFYFCLI
tara:strand:- start:218 stop:361 length:144 start_codon:yes stop_codon:yes gene_type:complete